MKPFAAQTPDQEVPTQEEIAATQMDNKAKGVEYAVNLESSDSSGDPHQ